MCMVGCFLLFIGVKSYRDYLLLQNRGKRTVGKIIKFESDDEGYKTPVVVFQDDSGTAIEGKPSYFVSTDLDKVWSPERYMEHHVEIIYDEKNPAHFFLVDGHELQYFFYGMLCLIGVLLVSVSMGVFWGLIHL